MPTPADHEAAVREYLKRIMVSQEEAARDVAVIKKVVLAPFVVAAGLLVMGFVVALLAMVARLFTY